MPLLHKSAVDKQAQFGSVIRSHHVGTRREAARQSSRGAQGESSAHCKPRHDRARDALGPVASEHAPQSVPSIMCLRPVWHEPGSAIVWPRERSVVDPHSAAVMPSLVRAAVIAVVVMLVAGACGSSSHTSSTKTTSSPSRRTASRQAGSLRLDDIGATAGCAGYGASYVTGVGVHPAQSFLSIVCAPLTGSVTDNGVPGSSLQSDLLRTLRRVPRDAPNQLSIIMWGINDLGWFGDHLGAFQAGLRLLISRLRTSDWNIHTFQDPTLSYAGPWRNLLGAKVTSGDASFVWRSPSGFPGGELAFVTLLRRGIGGRYAFSVDGRRVGEFSTRAAPAPRPARTVNTPGAFRIRVPARGRTCRPLHDHRGFRRSQPAGMAARVGAASTGRARRSAATPDLSCLCRRPRAFRAHRPRRGSTQPRDRRRRAGVRELRDRGPHRPQAGKAGGVFPSRRPSSKRARARRHRRLD